MDADCIHGLGPASACVLCNGRVERERQLAQTVERRFPARFASRLVCGHDVAVGERIAKMGDGSYRCDDCAP